jgi:phage protein D
LLHPRYSVKVGSKKIEPEISDDLIELRIHLNMDMPSNDALLFLRMKDGAGDVGISKNDPVSISIGYNDDLALGFTGVAEVLDLRTTKIRLHTLSSMTRLSNLRVDRFYEQQSAGAIVKDLANSAGVAVGEVSDGIQLPYYTVDSNKNGYEHIKCLAHLCGFDVYASNEDKLVFKKYEKSGPKTLEYGKNIIRLVKIDQQESVDSVKVFGESPSSSKGSDKAHWLTKENVQGSAGSGPQLFIQSRIVRDEDTASAVAKAALDKAKLSVLVEIEVLGDPEIQLGDTVKITSMPNKYLDGELQVRSVEHFLSKPNGFTTIIRCRSVAKSS